MTTPKKILVATVATVFVGFILLVVLAKTLVTPERIKSVLLPRVEQALNRRVQLEGVDIRLFSGIVLKKAAIMERQGDAPFLAAEQMTLRYRFWPLLFMRVEIDEIAIDGPQIHLVRLADGTFNFSDLIQSGGEKGAGAEEAGGQTEAVGGTDGGLQLLVSRLAIRQGTILLTDQQTKAAPRNYRLDGLSLQIDRFSLNEPFPLQLAGVLNGAPLAVEGRADLVNRAVEAKVQLTGLQVMPFAPYFAAAIPGRLEQALLDLDLQLSGRGAQLASEGRVTARDVVLQLEALPDAPVQGAQLSVDYSLEFDRAQQRLLIKHGRLAFNELPLYVDGKLQQAPATRLDLNLRFNELDIAKALGSLPAGLVKKAAGLQPSGLVTARLHLVGSPQRPKELLRDGELRLDALQALVGGLRPSLSGLITVKGDSLLSEGLVAVLGDNRLQLDLEAQPFKSLPVVAVADIHSDRLAVDQLLPSSSVRPALPAPSPSSGGGPSPSTPSEPLDLPLKLSGTATVKKALYRGLVIDDFKARYRLENNVLQVEELTGQVAGGTFRNSASIDLGRPGLAYRAKIATQGIQADPLLTAFVPKAAGTVFGLLNLDLDLAGQGTELATLRKHLSGRGELLLREGRLTGSGLQKGLADFLGLTELSVMGFDQADGRFAIQNGRFDVASTLVSHDFRLAPRGNVGLDGTLDLGLDLRLSPALTEKLGSSGRFAQLLVDAEGWGQVPLKVKGSLARPSFALDSAVIKSAVKEQAQQRLQETLEKQLFGKDEEPAEQNASGDKEKKLLEGVIKGLFGQ